LRRLKAFTTAGKHGLKRVRRDDSIHSQIFKNHIPYKAGILDNANAFS
jgi:hypothetical protein